MKKFILMIFGISIFFTGLDGIVKQVADFFKSNETTLTFLEQKKTEKKDFVKTLTIQKENGQFIINEKNLRILNPDFQLPPAPPSSRFGKTFEFSRQISFDSPHNVEKSSHFGRNVIIIRREESEKSPISEPAETNKPAIESFCEMENKAE